MNTKTFIDENELNEFVKELTEDDNTIDIMPKGDGTFVVQWIKNKKYISYDGKEFTDEVWLTVDNKMVHVQDLEPEHARNIIRMMLRNSRRITQESHEVFMTLMDAIKDISSPEEQPPQYLH